MKLWGAYLATLSMLALPALARDISVRSGEHEGFTRLVFYTQPSDTYDLSITDEGYLLSFSPDITGFDLSRAFDLIDRTRIHALKPVERGDLAIQQECDCHVVDFRLSTGELVIDIKDGADPNNPPDATPETPPKLTVLNANQQRAMLPLFNPPTDQIELTGTQEERPDASPSDASGTESNIPKVDRQALLTQLSRAASQGLIDADVTPPDISQIVAPAENKMEPPELPHIAPTPEQHVRTQTAVEQAQADHAGGKSSSNAEHACLPDEQFDIAQWGAYTAHNNAPVFETSGYLGEFDRPDTVRLVAHIRQNIYMTFGLEALQLLGNYGDKLGDGSVLRMMAEVVEYGEATSHAVWTSQLGCNTRGALWAALAQPTLHGPVNTNAVLRSFSELPPHLRTHLGSVLARKFLNSGRVETAIEIRNIAARSGRPPTGEEAILDAKIGLATGQPDKAQQALGDTVQTSLTQTQPAISALIESKLHNDTGISDDELSLLASVAFEHQGSREGDALHRLHIRALLHMGRFAPAFQMIDALADPGSLLEEAGLYLEALGSDAEFLTYSLTRDDWGHISAAARLKMAKRQSALGFHEQARRLILSGDSPPTKSEREFLAQLALLQRKPKIALGYLAGLSTNTANLLREEATKLSNTPDADPQPEQTARLASDILEHLNTEEHPIPGPVQAVLASETPAPDVDMGSDLNTYQGLLDKSSETRAALTELLKIIPPPSRAAGN